ncbi:MAG TPA: hypothetical protein VHH36_07360 [Candidatus Thermoplasmatota archaeon]|nr:hypothetical protein [Candidatus Thermoplasmatota archaeon]
MRCRGSRLKVQTYREPAAWAEGDPLDPRETLDKEEAHRRGLLHRSVHLLLFDEDGRLHARRRSDDDARYAGLWTSTVGTHVAAGDVDERTLRAIVPPETALARVGEFRVKDDAENEVCGLFASRSPEARRILGPAHAALAPEEVEAAIREGRTTPHLAEGWRRYRAAGAG